MWLLEDFLAFIGAACIIKALYDALVEARVKKIMEDKVLAIFQKHS